MKKKNQLELGLDEVAKKTAANVDKVAATVKHEVEEVVNAAAPHIKRASIRLFEKYKERDIVSKAQMRAAWAKMRADIKAAEREMAKLGKVMEHVAEQTPDYALRSVYDSVNCAVGIVGARPLPIGIEPLDLFNATRDRLWSQFRQSAKRYAGGFGERLRLIMEDSANAGVSWGGMAQRIANDPKFIARVGGPGVAIAEGSTARARASAQRLVRTEASHALSQQQEEMIKWADSQDPGYERKWSAAADVRACPRCIDLDGRTAPIGKPFVGGYMYTPLHPSCRCCIVAWRSDWTKQARTNRMLGNQYTQKDLRVF